MTSTAPASFPALPLEISGHILRFCDPPTLAATSLVSLAFLELSGPVLYEDVAINGKRELEMMIRSEAVLPSVAPFVSPAQIKKFTYITLGAPDIDPDTSQTLASSVIVVDELVLDLRDDPTVDITLDVLLSSFDPLHLHVLNQPYGDHRTPGLLDIPDTLPWSRLRRATLTNSGLGKYLDGVAYLADRSPLLDLVYDLTGSAEDQDSLRYILLDVGADLEWEGGDSREGPAFGRVQVWLNDEDEVTLAKDKLVGCSCTSLEVGVKKPADT